MLLFQLMLLVHFPSFGLSYIFQYTVGTSIISLLHFSLVMVKACQNVKKYIYIVFIIFFINLHLVRQKCSNSKISLLAVTFIYSRSFGCHPFLLFSFELDLHLHRSHLCVIKWIFNAYTCLNQSLYLLGYFRAQVGSKRTK